MIQTKENKGITLIALVITVIILLIISAVAISAISSQDGLFSKADNASKKYESSSRNEAEQINELMQKMENDSGVVNNNTNPDNETNAETGVIYTSNLTINGEKSGTYNNPIIPKGFAPVNENGAIWGSTDGYKKGLVITDQVNANGESIGNEFVWVPVDGTVVKFERVNFGHLYPGSSWSSYSETVPVEVSSSVLENGGFYIARFEAGVENNTLVSKKNVPVNVNNTWSNASSKATSMYNLTNNNYGVVSTLAYGTQWDTTLKFIEAYDTGENGYANYATTATGIGNLKEGDDITETTPVNCGISEEFRQKNIYDMSGNAWEWTMEKISTNCVIRGSHCGQNQPPAYRDYAQSTFSSGGACFRVALYIMGKYDYSSSVKASNIKTQDETFNGQTTGTYNNPIIPKGFYAINANGATWGSADGYKKGLVISDSVNEKGESNGNEFVWVPVDGTVVKFERVNFGYLYSGTSWSSYSESVPTVLTASVNNNGGFYISRFEAGVENNTLVSKPFVNVNVNNTWTNAKSKAEAMYPSTDTNHGGVSTLVYGTQWDTTLKFIEAYDTGESGYASYATTSTGIGNLKEGDNVSSTTPTVTGISSKFRQKNIYDMSGNAWEWTMEKISTNCVIRGSHCGQNQPPAYRDYAQSTFSSGNACFRIALYI